MHILVVASTFPTHDDDPVPAFVRDQVIALRKAYPELTFSVLAPHDKRSATKSFTKHDSYDEYRFHYFCPFSLEKLAGRGIMPALQANPLNYLLVPFLFIGEFIALLRLTRRLKPDMIYAHWFTPQVVITRLVCIFTKTPFVFTTHASDVAVWHKIPLIGKSIVRGNTEKAERFTAVSNRSMEKLEKFFPASEWKKLKLSGAIIPMGVDIPDTKNFSEKTSSKKSIVFVGRLAEKKGIQYLLPAFAKLRADNLDAELVIGGDGPMLAELQEQAQTLGVSDHVSFPGYVSGSAKQKLIASADVYVVPSIVTDSGDAEGLPVSLLEGLAYGNICVATYESGADDILTDGKNGFLIPEKDVNALQQVIAKSLELSATEKKQMSTNARSTAQQFSWSAIAKKHYDFLFRQPSDQ